jgi:hypothetical protein
MVVIFYWLRVGPHPHARPIRRSKTRYLAAAQGCSCRLAPSGPLPAGLLDVESQPSSKWSIATESVQKARRAWHEGRRSTWPVCRTTGHGHDRGGDGRFRRHPGVDPIAAAPPCTTFGAHACWRADRRSRSRSLLIARQSPNGRPPRGWLAKLHEAVVAFRLEHRLSKQQIVAHFEPAQYGIRSKAPNGPRVRISGEAHQPHAGGAAAAADPLHPCTTRRATAPPAARAVGDGVTRVADSG